MATFKVRMKLEGFELEIEGEREDAALITEHIGEQFSSLLKPIDGIVEGKPLEAQPSLDLQAPEPPKKKTTRRRAPSPKKSSPDDQAEFNISFRHSAEKYGNPDQNWKTAQKAMWLIYVLVDMNLGKEFSTRQIVETFNSQFRQMGSITTSNVTRDLGRQRQEKPPTVGEDPTSGESKWYLTEGGTRNVQNLIAEALRPTEGN